MSTATNRTLCHCPGCDKIFWQWHVGDWNGARRSAVRLGHGVRALAEENNQRTDRYPWIGHAICADCSLRRLPPSLRLSAGTWCQQGEEQCDC